MSASLSRQVFLDYLNTLLQPELVKDYCPNGLQVQGSETITRVITGVTATQALINQAIAEKADAIVVHHGYFWKNEPYQITGMKYNRIKALLDNNINLFAYHLPLDIHPEIGNNAQLAQLLNLDTTGPLELGNATSVALQGKYQELTSGEALATLISQKLNRECLHIAPPSNKAIKTVAWCTGGGQGYIELAAQQGIDAFITGEVSEQTTHIAQEMDIHFYSAGHHATERYGVKALAENIQLKLGITADFIDIDNPV